MKGYESAERRARIIIIRNGVKDINEAIKRLGGEGTADAWLFAAISPVKILVNERARLCQERRRLEAEEAEATKK